MFQDYLDELEKIERDEERVLTKQHIDNLRNLFEEQKLGLDTSWEQCCQMFATNPIFKIADNLERITAFNDYMKGAEDAYYAEKRRIKRYHERKNRELYREMLNEKFRQGQFTIKTKWNKFVNQIKDDPRYLNMVGQAGSTPKELFDDFISAEKEIFKQQKGTLKQIIKTGTIDLNSQMTFEDFDAEFGKYPEYSKIEEKNRRFLHEYVVTKVKEKEQETLKKYTKALKKYENFLKSLDGISKTSQYDEFRKIINEKEKFDIIPEEEKSTRFYYYALRIDDKSRSISEESGAIEKPKKDKRKSKRHHSRSSSEHDKKKKRKHDSSEEYEHRKRSKHHDRERRRSKGRDDKSKDESRSKSRHKSKDASRDRNKNPEKTKDKNTDKTKELDKIKDKTKDKEPEKTQDKGVEPMADVTSKSDSKI